MKRILPFLILCLAAGCIEVEIRTRIEPDGGGQQRWMFRSSALLAGKLRKNVEEQFRFSSRQAKISETFREGEFILTAELPFHSTKELEDKFHSIQFERTGVFRRTFRYTETWRRGSWEGDVPVRIRVSVEMPGPVTESNADRVEGNAANWDLSVSGLDQPRELRAQSVQWNYAAVLPIAGLILLIAASAAVWSAGFSRHRGKDT